MFLISNTSRSSLYISPSPIMSVLLSSALPQEHICSSSSSCRLLEYLVPLPSSWQVQVLYTKLQFQRFSRGPLGRINTFFNPISAPNLPYTSKCSPPSTVFFNPSRGRQGITSGPAQSGNALARIIQRAKRNYAEEQRALFFSSGRDVSCVASSRRRAAWVR